MSLRCSERSDSARGTVGYWIVSERRTRCPLPPVEYLSRLAGGGTSTSGALAASGETAVRHGGKTVSAVTTTVKIVRTIRIVWVRRLSLSGSRNRCNRVCPRSAPSFRRSCTFRRSTERPRSTADAGRASPVRRASSSHRLCGRSAPGGPARRRTRRAVSAIAAGAAPIRVARSPDRSRSRRDRRCVAATGTRRRSPRPLDSRSRSCCT